MPKEGQGVSAVQVERKVLAKNDDLAAANRAWLKTHGVTAINFISSPGAGKTLLLEQTLERLKGVISCGVIVGDPQTDNDARRMANRGARVRQIETANSCHLDAARVAPFLEEVVGSDVKLLFIENVGNLLCPAAFDLGEDFKVVLLSCTEGEDKPIKYPTIFSRVQAVIITKSDLAPHLDWDRRLCFEYLRKTAPGAKIFELSAKSGEGMDGWINYLAETIRHV